MAEYEFPENGELESIHSPLYPDVSFIPTKGSNLPMVLPGGQLNPNHPNVYSMDTGETVATDHAKKIMSSALPDAVRLFVRKSNSYGEPDGDDLGIKGQYADMHRKWKRLRGYMWEGKEWTSGGESFEEVCQDMIGHLLKTIQFHKEEEL